VLSIQSPVQDETLQSRFIAENEETLIEGEKNPCGRDRDRSPAQAIWQAGALAFPRNTEN
jgi:hypothetical protein